MIHSYPDDPARARHHARSGSSPEQFNFIFDRACEIYGPHSIERIRLCTNLERHQPHRPGRQPEWVIELINGSEHEMSAEGRVVCRCLHCVALIS